MIWHCTIGRAHVTLRNPEPGTAASKSLVDAAVGCPNCGADFFVAGEISRPNQRDSRAKPALRCFECKSSWPLLRGDPLEVER